MYHLVYRVIQKINNVRNDSINHGEEKSLYEYVFDLEWSTLYIFYPNVGCADET